MTQYQLMGYTRSTIHGLSADGFVKVGSFAVKALKLIILARLLSPNDFGLFSLVMVALGLMEAVTETGINIIMVQSNKSVSYFLDTAWVISLVRGVLISILMVLIGFILQSFYSEPLLLVYIAIAALIPIMRGAINPSVVKWYKDLQFFQDAAYRFVLVLFDFFASVIVVFAVRSTLGLILGLLLAAGLEVILSFAWFSPRPRFAYIKSRAHEIFENSKGLNLSAILNYVVENIDNVLIGRFVGTTDLGLYANGYSLGHKPNLELSKSVQRSTLPIYAQLAKDKSRLSKGFLKTTVLSMLIFTVFSLPLIFFPDWIIHTFLGDQWLGVIPILPMLVAAGLIQSFTVLVSSLFTTERKYFWLNANLFINLVSLIPLLYVLRNNGIQGGVTAVLWSRILTVPFTLVGIWQTIYQK